MSGPTGARQPAAVAGRRAAVLGVPVAHSLSPLLHRAAYAALGLTGWTYDAREVDRAALATFLAELDESWVGLSLTMPLKQAVLPLLDEVGESVATTGVCNTVLLADGRRRGENTDIAGIVAALAEGGLDPGSDPVGERAGAAHVLGGGATAASAVAALGRLGRRAVTAHVRDPSRATAVREAATNARSELTLAPWPDTPLGATALAVAEVVVATTPGGTTAAVAAALPVRVRGLLLDVAYEPWPSTLATAWGAAGGRVVPGVLMLLHQAAVQVHLMTGSTAPLSAMRVALARARAELSP